MTSAPPRSPSTEMPGLAEAVPGLDALVRRDPGVGALARTLMQDDSRLQRGSYRMLVRLRELKLAAPSAAAAGKRVAAFFDLDGTVIRGSIILHLFEQGLVDGHRNLRYLAQFASLWLLYKLNLIPALTMYRWGYAPASGYDIREVQDFVDRCIATRVRPAVYQEAVDAIAAHRAAGHRCVAVTGAPDYPAAELCAGLGLDDVLATPTPLTADGLITADVQEPVCYGAGKLSYLRAYAAAHDIDVASSFFYSDSASDIPVLKAVGFPRVVNAQWLLLPVAWWQRWDRVQWRRPAAVSSAT